MLPLLERKVAIALWIHIEEGSGHEAHDDQRGQEDAGNPWIVIHQHLLQSEKIPWGLRWVRSDAGIRRLFEGRLEEYRPDDHNGAENHHTDQLGVDEVGPDPDFVVRCVFLDGLKPLRRSTVVLERLVQRKQDKKPHKKNQGNYSNVFRLGHNI